MSFNRETTTARVDDAILHTAGCLVEDLPPGLDFAEIPGNRAYRVHAAHVYVDIANADTMLRSDQAEGERTHQRFLRFLHLWDRAAHLVFERTGATKVDFQNHRLHFIVASPSGNERQRIARAVATGHVLRQLLLDANVRHAELPDAQVCVGVESGLALAVRNGTNGDREPLFLGDPANLAAKLAGVGGAGVYLGLDARRVLGAEWSTSDPLATTLATKNVDALVVEAALGVSVDDLLRQWKSDLQATPLADFDFHRPSPPLKDLDFEQLSPAHTARIVSAAIFADVDGYTRFISRCLASRNELGAVRALHVIRKELRDVLRDHGGRKVRYIGDCLVGVLADGDTETDAERTVDQATLCVAAMRDAFGIIQARLLANGVIDIGELGLGIGYDLGTNVITRLGVRNSRDRCLAGRAVLDAQVAQESCSGSETMIGAAALAAGSKAVKEVYINGPKRTDLGYNYVANLIKANDPKRASMIGIGAAAPLVIPGRAYCGPAR